MTRVTVLGAGSWGTALAKHLARKGEQVRLWSRRRELTREMRERRENAAYLRGFSLPESLLVTSELGAALEGAEAVLFVVPSHGLRELARACKPLLPEGAALVSATKGIENERLML